MHPTSMHLMQVTLHCSLSPPTIGVVVRAVTSKIRQNETARCSSAFFHFQIDSKFLTIAITTHRLYYIYNDQEIRTMNQQPIAPPSEPTPSTMANIIPLDSPLRTTPIHQLLPDIQVPGPKESQDKNDQEAEEHNKNPLKPHHYHPMTCAPIPLEKDTEEKQQLDALRREYQSPEDALKEQEQVAREAKRRIEAATKKREEVQRAMDKKVKERNTEMKVLSKYQEVKASDILPS